MTNDSNSMAHVGVEVAGVQKDQDNSRPRITTSMFLSSDSIKHAELTDIATEVGSPGGAPKLLKKQQTSGPLIPASTESFLDPTSQDFNVYEWAKMVMCVADNANVKMRRASFAFKNLHVSGSGAASAFQATVASILMAPFRLHEYVTFGKKPKRKILYNLEGLTEAGEMLLVLGRPGSGCSTFLKTVAGELHGLEIDRESEVHYNGIPQTDMIDNFKGEIVYNAEVDNHFPYLTVKETLEFAAALRTPQNRLLSTSRTTNMTILIKVVLAVCGLRHVQNTRVGNDFVRGVSGGERKRVSIAEMLLASASIGCWDNSTKGLDAATALEFVRTLRSSSEILGTTHAVAIYQASQAIYDLFDKVIVFYEGREIYFGGAATAKAYFEDMGWHCPSRQTTGDFLASVTSPTERKTRTGYEARVPRTSSDFEKHWLASSARQTLVQALEQHDKAVVAKGSAKEFIAARNATQSRHIRSKSPYMVSIPMQLKTCTKRAYRRIWNDKASTFTVIIGQVIMALVVGSVYFGITKNTNSFFSTGSTLFFAVLLNALIAVTEINNLYQQRPIVEKQASYALCHPFAEALAGIIADAPVKLVIAVFFNVILYFLAGLRPEPSQFFIFFLFTVLALALAGVLILAMVIYTGYTIPRPYMHPWFMWLSYINPLAYAFEALLVNEMHGRNYPCASIVPPQSNLSGGNFICSVAGAVSGEVTVSGDAYVDSSFEYSYSHIWRNLGILIAFWVFFLLLYLLATELNSSTSSSADVLIFRRGHLAETARENVEDAHEKKGLIEVPLTGPKSAGSQNPTSDPLQPHKSVFTWRNVVYDVELKEGPKRLLDNVSGWVRPGTLTALMGVSGAGKTTLLDVLAQRVTTGIITGDMFVNGKPLAPSFQRRTGYVQQQDLHLETSTVREALRFSAMLRQPKSVSQKDKYRHVEDVIEMLDMHEFSSAIVGVPGGGLNVQQRKLLSIGVELAAKPALLIFLDEPTSGLDSQSSWAVVGFLRKLANNGQAVLATIHQPSSILFQEFDRLLFLAKGGRTVYFGEIGDQSETLLQYFQNGGARFCGDTENPAEYILECVSDSRHDWPDLWKKSREFQAMIAEQERIHHDTSVIGQDQHLSGDDSLYATPLYMQLKYTTLRILQQSWRTPSYIWGKFLLGGVSAFFIGFSFINPGNSLQGMQNVVFSIFMLTSILSSLVQQIMPRFVMQRSLYEVRERPSKVYSWVAFTIANIVVEIPYQFVLGIVVYVCYYYPVYGIESSERQVLILLFCIQIFIFASTFAHLVIVALPDAQTAGAVATLLFAMAMIFNGVFQPPQALPGFWIFMYRVSPLTYIVSGIAATGLHGRNVSCSANEMNKFNPPSGMTCGEYLAPFFSAQAPGHLSNPDSATLCQYCPLSTADQFLAVSKISWDARWRNFGIGWAYIVFNVAATVVLYYLFRVRIWSGYKFGKGPIARVVLLWAGFIGARLQTLLVKGDDHCDSGTDLKGGGGSLSVRLY